MVQASSNRASSSIAAPLAHINRLESDLFSLPFDPNPLRPLLALARHPSPEIVHKAIWALHRAFIKFLHEEKIGGFTGIGVGRARGGELMEVVESGEERETVRGWLRERLEDYLEVLAGLVRDSEPALRVCVRCIGDLERVRLFLPRARRSHSSSHCSHHFHSPSPNPANHQSIHLISERSSILFSIPRRPYVEARVIQRLSKRIRWTWKKACCQLTSSKWFMRIIGQSLMICVGSFSAKLRKSSVFAPFESSADERL